jgi:hypothetical protein
MYAVLISLNASNPLSFSAFLFYSFGFILPGFYVVRTGDFYWYSHALNDSVILHASIIAFTSTCFLYLGRFSRLNSSPARSQNHEGPQLNSTSLNTRQKQALVIVILLACTYVGGSVAIYGTKLFWGTRASTSIYANDIGLNSTTIGLVRLASQSLALTSFATTAYCRFVLKDKSPTITLSFYAAVCLILVANNPLFTPRYWMVATMTVMMLTLWGQTYRSFKHIVFLLTPILMFLVFPFLGTMNRRGSSLSFDFDVVSPTEFMSHGDLDGFQSITNAVHLVSGDGFSYGSRILSAFLFFIPRSIWEGKHISTGSDAAEAAGYSFTRISMPLPGEFYVDGGLLFVAIGMFLIGAAIRRLDQAFDTLPFGYNNKTNPAPLITIILAGFAPILLRGSLLSVINGAFLSSFLLLLWMVLSRLSIKTR